MSRNIPVIPGTHRGYIRKAQGICPAAVSVTDNWHKIKSCIDPLLLLSVLVELTVIRESSTQGPFDCWSRRDERHRMARLLYL